MNKAIVRRQYLKHTFKNACFLLKLNASMFFSPHNNTEMRICKTIKEFCWCTRTVSAKPVRIHITKLFPRLLVHRFKRLIFIFYGNYVSYFAEL